MEGGSKENNSTWLHTPENNETKQYWLAEKFKAKYLSVLRMKKIASSSFQNISDKNYLFCVE